jgi:nicotinamide-nucleotide amidase
MGKPIGSAEIICVGTELLLGDIVNTNATFLSRGLADLGIPLYRHTAVGDNPGRLSSALAEAFSRCDAVFLSGGLGPTCDDLTKETVAAFFGLPLRTDEHTAERIRSHFAGTHRLMTDNNLKQAMVPEGATVFDNDYGTAPALAVDKDGKLAVMLPGPPSELEPIWRDRIVPFLSARSDGIIVSHNVYLAGIGESAVEDRLRGLMVASENPTIAPYVQAGEVRLRVSARAADRETGDRLCFELIDRVKAGEVGPYVYGIDVGSAENALLSVLRERGMTLSCAESCTGGLIAKLITDVPGCSDVFAGGCVTYSNAAKISLLGVSPATLERFGAVSEQTAAEMARGARTALGTDVALATTGIAGPGGGTPEKPVGTVYIAVSRSSGETVEKLSLSPKRDRAFIRRIAATRVLELALRLIGGK